MSKSLTDPWWVKKGLSKPPTLREADSWAKHKKEKDKMKLDLNKILVATDFIKEVAEELGYDHSDTLAQLLDEIDTEAMNTLEEE